jgi:cytochrome bd-type quinol oxidase subunit 2
LSLSDNMMIIPTLIHLHTSFLPVYFGGTAIVLHNSGRILHNDKLINLSYKLYIITGVVTTFTCAFGGASVRAAEASGIADPAIMRIHAWTAMLVFLLSLAIGYYSYKALRLRIHDNKTENRLLLLSSVFLIVFICTTIFAFRIR